MSGGDMQEELSRLFKEISDVKQLLLQCPYGHTTPAAFLGELVSSQLHDHAHTVQPRPSPIGEQPAVYSVLPCPKASVHLDLPCEEQDKLSCEAAAEREPEQPQPQQQPQQQQPQQQHAAPLLLRGQGLKPSISSAVMLQRAVHAAQHVQGADPGPQGLVISGGEHLSSAADAQGNGLASPGRSWPLKEALQRDATGTPCSQEVCSMPGACDAAVHVSTAAASSKQDLQPSPMAAEQVKVLKSPAASSCRTAAACKEVDMLAKRVHSSGPGLDDQAELQPPPQDAQPRLWETCCLAVLRTIKGFIWDIVLPADIMVLLWDLIMLLLIIYLCIALPYTVAFAIDFTDLTHPLAQVDLAASSLFLFDVWMNFRTAFVGDDGKVVQHRGRIAKHYLQSWFLFDLFSSIPYEQLLSTDKYGVPSFVAFLKIPRLLRIVKVLRLLKLLRMARLAKLPHLMSKLEWLLNRPMAQLSLMCAGVCMLLHWIACAWYYTAVVVDDPNNWVVNSGMANADDGTKYVSALYWSISTVATVGFGDIVAHSLREKIVALITMLIGASVFGYFMGAMSVMVSATSSSRARMTAKRRAVDDFLTHRRVPRVLADKVKSYYDYVVEREVQADEADIISGLSASLHTQVVLHLYKEALEKVPFFRGQHPQFITSVVTFLQLEYYAPGDVVVRQGEFGDSMYFLAQGSLEVRLCNEDCGGSPMMGPDSQACSTDAGNQGNKPASSLPPVDHQNQGQQSEQQSSARGNSSWLNGLLRRRRTAAWASNDRTDGNSEAGPPQAEPEQEAPDMHPPWGTGGQWADDDELAQKPYRLGFLRPGEYFGEYSCLLGQERSATVVASTYVELYSLSRADLEAVLQQWPELAEQFEAMVQEAVGSQFPNGYPASPQGVAYNGPLASWNIAKAACHQQGFANATATEVQRGHNGAAVPAAGYADPASDQAPEQQGRPELMQHQMMGVHAVPAFRSSQACTTPRRSAYQAGAWGPMHAGHQQRGSFDHQLQHHVLQQARTDPMAITAAAAALANRPFDSSWQQWSQQGVMTQPTSADAAVSDFPSLAARSLSCVSNTSVSSASGRLARNQHSQSLSRRSVPAGRACSSSGGGVNLSRVSTPASRLPGPQDHRRSLNWQPGQGSGLFRTNSGQRYIFPGSQTRSNVLAPPAEAEEVYGADAALLPQQGALTRRSYVSRISQ